MTESSASRETVMVVQRRLYMVTEKEFLKVLNNKERPEATTAVVGRGGVAGFIDGGGDSQTAVKAP